MFTRRSRHVLLTVLVTFSLAAAACSSGGGGDSNPAVKDLGDDTEIPDGFGDSPGSGDAGFFGSAECEQLLDAMSSFDVGDSSATNLESTADFLHEAAENAPSDVADDLEVIADTYDALADDPSSAVELFSGDFTDATTNLATWIGENCGGLDIDG